jgi:hypothetical protein
MVEPYAAGLEGGRDQAGIFERNMAESQDTHSHQLIADRVRLSTAAAIAENPALRGDRDPLPGGVKESGPGGATGSGAPRPRAGNDVILDASVSGAGIAARTLLPGQAARRCSAASRTDRPLHALRCRRRGRTGG